MSSLGQLLEKLGRDAGFNARDLLELRQKGNNLEAVESAFHTWSDPGQTSPQFSHLYAAEAEFGTAPLDSGRIISAGSDAVTVATSTWTTLLDVGETTQDFGIKCDVDTGIFDLRAKAAGEGAKFLYWWHVAWEANATGDRLFSLYDTGDTELVRWTATASAYGSAGDVVHNGTYWWGITGYSADTHYFKVWQNSGGNLDVEWFRIGCIRIH